MRVNVRKTEGESRLQAGNKKEADHPPTALQTVDTQLNQQIVKRTL